jgi:hypothetical protein
VGTALGVRYDFFDPDIHNTHRWGGDGEQHTVGVSARQQVGDSVIFSLCWERQRIQREERHEDEPNESTRYDPGPVRFLTPVIIRR